MAAQLGSRPALYPAAAVAYALANHAERGT